MSEMEEARRRRWWWTQRRGQLLWIYTTGLMVVVTGASVRLFVQDATAELPKGKLPLWSDGSASSGDPHCDLIVCNPPWGKNIGKHEDGGPIVLSLCRQFVGVTMVLLVNKYTRAVRHDCTRTRRQARAHACTNAQREEEARRPDD